MNSARSFGREKSEIVDYVVVGHVTQDLTLEGPVPGGTATFAALTVRVLGARPGIVSSVAQGARLDVLEEIPRAVKDTRESTVFQNTYTDSGRIQHVSSIASPLDVEAIPLDWRKPDVLHLGPVIDEVDPGIISDPRFDDCFIGLTPQGWMRDLSPDGLVSWKPWVIPMDLAERVSAVVISEEDVRRDEEVIRGLARAFKMLVVTRGPKSVRVFEQGEPSKEIPVRERVENDPTGAGDIFAASFFWLSSHGVAPGEAAGCACDLASKSVRQPGLGGIPSLDTVEACLSRIRAEGRWL